MYTAFFGGIMDKILEFLNMDRAMLLEFGKDVLMVTVFTLIAVKFIDLLFKKIDKARRARGANVTGLSMLKRVIKIVVISAACAAIISTVPVLDSAVSSILAGSGIAAVIAGLASQEALANFVSGVIIITSNPFQVGDIIRYIDNDISGEVEEITLRHTIVRTFENKRLIIPNGMINSTAIENVTYTHDPLCQMLEFSVTYESDAEKAMQIIAKIVREHPKFRDVRTQEQKNAGAPEVKVRVVNFDSSAVVLRAWVWSDDPGTGIDMKSDILLAVQKEFAASGIEFAYPHIHVVESK